MNKDNRIVGMGYNGMPDGCSDTEFPWTKGDTAETDKHLYGMHTFYKDMRYLDLYGKFRILTSPKERDKLLICFFFPEINILFFNFLRNFLKWIKSAFYISIYYWE